MRYLIIHGVDLLNVHPVAFKVLEKNKEFFEKLFTPTEISYCQNKDGDTNKALSFAARLAIKGAVAKMLGANYDMIGSKDIEIVNDCSGKPNIVLRGKAMELALKIGIEPKNIAISISNTDELIMASAVAVKKNKKRRKQMAAKKSKGVVKIEDDAAAYDAKMESNVKNSKIRELFTLIAKNSGLTADFKTETVDYGDNLLTVTLFDRSAPLPVARFLERIDIILPSPIIIQFRDQFRDRLNDFVATVKKAAKTFDVDITIKVVKSL